MPHPFGRGCGVSRPWDVAGGGRKRLKKEDQSAGRASSHNCNNDVPSVLVDGISHYSDRFYLSSSDFDREGSAGTGMTTTCQTCKDAAKLHPLIDVSRLVASLSLRAAMLGTFSLDTEWFLEQFPSLARVPTLVMHGQRGMADKKLVGGAGGSNHDNDQDVDDESSIDSMASEELYTQPEETIAYARAVANCRENMSRDGDVVGEDNLQSSALHFTKVVTKWVPPIGGVGTHTAEFKPGVHHPKFLLLWETSGSLIVVVSTGNLTPRRTIDGVWLQRFHPRSSSQATPSAFSSSSTGGSPLDDFGCVLQNLLTAQTHAIQVQAKNQDRVPMTPYAFCRKYLGWENLDPISSMYDYAMAQVHLIATVPGLYSDHAYGRQRVAHILEQVSDSSRTINLPRYSRCIPWLPPKLLTSSDRLIVQPTSFGDWSRPSMAKVVQSYLSKDSHNDPLDRLDIVWPTERFIQSVRSTLKALRPDKVTPLKQLKQSSPKPRFYERLPRRRLQPEEPSNGSEACALSPPPLASNQHERHGILSSPRPEGVPHERRTHGGYMFLSSSTFNKIDVACLSRMMQWEPSHPIPLSRRPTLVSHLKTIARVVGAPNHLSDPTTTKKAQQQLPWYVARGADGVFSWLLMTSACLSRGAQGESIIQDENKNANESVSYANFELGVLFCSRLQHKPTDRIYCWKESRCGCSSTDRSGIAHGDTARPLDLLKNHPAHPHRGTNGGGPRMIALPIPYRLDAASYQLDEDDLEFAETPYFHEITPSDCAVGNMRMTPFGDYVARKRGDD